MGTTGIRKKPVMSESIRGPMKLVNRSIATSTSGRRRAKARAYPSMSRLSLAKPPDGTARACIASVKTAGSREEAP